MQSRKKGYTISISHKARDILNVRAWGVWGADDKELAEHFTMELQDKVKEISAHAKEWSVCEDFVELCPQSREICRIMGDGLIFAIRHGMKKAVHCETQCSSTGPVLGAIASPSLWVERPIGDYHRSKNSTPLSI